MRTIIFDWKINAFFSFEKESKLTAIEEFSISYCLKLKNISFKNQLNLITIPNNAFHKCSKLERISFCECIELKSISIPSGIKYINDYGFYNCSKLETISIPSSVESIGIYSFYGCISLISIKLPSQLKEISSNLFEGCSKLKSITILSNISKIEDFAFLNCSNLEYVQYFGTEEPNVSQNTFQGFPILKYIYTNSRYSSETFGTFKVQKTLKLSNLSSSLRNRMIVFIISGPIFICTILLITVFRRKKYFACVTNKEWRNF